MDRFEKDVMEKTKFIHIVNYGEKHLRDCVREAVEKYEIPDKMFYSLFSLTKDQYIDYIYNKMGGNNYGI